MQGGDDMAKDNERSQLHNQNVKTLENVTIIAAKMEKHINFFISHLLSRFQVSGGVPPTGGCGNWVLFSYC